MRYKFENIKELGRGSFGVVYEARSNDDGENVDKKDKGQRLAIKVINTGEDEAKINKALEEVRSHFKFPHRNIVEYFGCDLISDKENYIIKLPEMFELSHNPFGYRACVILMELCDTTLDKQLVGRYQIRSSINNSVFLDILKGVDYLHENGFIHRDLKPNNILAKLEDRKYIYKISDFGLGKFVDVRSEAMVSAPRGSPLYRAPEQNSSETITTKADIHSLGVILAELYTLKRIETWPQIFIDNWRLRDSNMEREIERRMAMMMNTELGNRYISYEISQELRSNWIKKLFDMNWLELPLDIKTLISQMTNEEPESRQDCKALISFFVNRMESN